LIGFLKGKRTILLLALMESNPSLSLCSLHAFLAACTMHFDAARHPALKKLTGIIPHPLTFVLFYQFMLFTTNDYHFATLLSTIQVALLTVISSLFALWLV
jgi:hypothetical protein